MAGLVPPTVGSGGDEKTSRTGETLADGRGHDRQILVVGNGLAAAATAGFLEQAGLDPVLASAEGDHTRSTVVPLWEPGLALLERLGLRRPVERLGTHLDRLDCVTTGQSWTADGTDRPSLVAIRRDQLGRLLDRQLLDRIRTAERSVTDVEPTESGVRATFEQRIEEPFDTVVTTTRSLVPAAETVTQAATAHTWEFLWPSTVSAPDAPTESWAENYAAFTVPAGNGTHVRLVASGETEPIAAVSVSELEGRFGPLFDGLGDPFDGLAHHALRYRQTPRVVPTSVSVGGVALAGPAAHAPIPGGCLGPALGVEDAWVLADALAYGPPSTAEALTDYERRRRRRVSEVASIFRDGAFTDRAPVALSPLLREICAARTLAFGHLLDAESSALARDVPGCL